MTTPAAGPGPAIEPDASMSVSFRQNVAVLFSESTRRAYVEEALAAGATYAFVGADGRRRQWLRGQYAYLAPNAATVVLNRFNVKHDVLSEDEVVAGGLAEYQLLLVPNAGMLRRDVSDTIEAWIAESGQDDRRLVVTGRTNLPPPLLGVEQMRPIEPSGYSAWQILPGLAFASSHAWADAYLTSYRGYVAMQVTAGASGKALASLWDVPDVRDRDAPRTHIGDAIIASDRTLYIANQVFEYIGGVVQAHLNIDEVRDWGFPTHYLDTIGYVLRALLIDVGLESLFTSQLRSFGTYTGMLVLRHDADVMPGEELDVSMLHWQQANQIPATYVVLDPDVSPEHTTDEASAAWVREASRTNLLEVGLHNDGYAGSPPTFVAGRALCDHVQAGDQRLGITSATTGRHFGFHYHPESLDAMEHLYDRAQALLGMCTFSVLQVIEYGVQDPDTTWLGRPITYSTRYRTDDWTSGAVTGWWFPHHVVISTVAGQRTLRGWDSTKESECDFARIDELLAADNVIESPGSTRLPNPVVTIQYHPQNAHSPRVNHGQGSLSWVQYLCFAAERHGFGLATKRTVYERLVDYETVRFRVDTDGSLLLANPGARTISGLMATVASPVETVLGDGYACIHIVGGTAFTLPPVRSQQMVRLMPRQAGDGIPRITQPNSRQLEILSAVHSFAPAVTEVAVRASGRSNLVIENLPADRVLVELSGDTGIEQHQLDAGNLVLPIQAPEDAVVTMRIVVRLNA